MNEKQNFGYYLYEKYFFAIMINEDYTYLKNIINEVVSLVDNFDMVAKSMEFKSPDDFYFVQIMKRYKDNPNDNKKQGNYHGGAWYLGGYRIHSAQELMQKKQEIIKICDANNARAYISVNTRSDIETDKQILKIRKIYPSSDPRNIYADQIVPGQAKEGPNWKNVRPLYFLDIDTPDQWVWSETKNMLKVLNIPILNEYETPSGGLHIILGDKNHEGVKYLQYLLRKFDHDQDKGRNATVHPNFDGKIILYSNVNTKGY